MHQQNYAIQDFTHRQIIEYFNDMQIPVAQNELLRPTPQGVQTLYETILNVFTNTKIIEFIPDNESTEALYFCILLKHLNDFVSHLGFQVILRDIIAPEQKRLISILSTIMNFSMYRDTKRDLYEDVIKSCREKEDMKDKIEDKINEALKRLEGAEQNHKKERVEQEMIEKEINAIEENLKTEYKNYRVVASVVDRLKNEKNELSDRESSNQLLLVNCKQEIACLKTQIVSDPTKLLELLTEMKEMVAKEKIQIEKFEVKRNLIHRNTAFLQNLREEIIMRIKKCAILNGSLKKGDEMNKKVSYLQSEIVTRVNNSEGFKKKIALLEKQIQQVEGKLNSLKENSEINNQDVIGKMDKLKISYDKINKDRMSLSEKIEANINWAKNIESEMITKYGDYNNFVNDRKAFLMELREAIAFYFNEVRYVLGKFNQQGLM